MEVYTPCEQRARSLTPHIHQRGKSTLNSDNYTCTKCRTDIHTRLWSRHTASNEAHSLPDDKGQAQGSFSPQGRGAADARCLSGRRDTPIACARSGGIGCCVRTAQAQLAPGDRNKSRT